MSKEIIILYILLNVNLSFSFVMKNSLNPFNEKLEDLNLNSENTLIFDQRIDHFNQQDLGDEVKTFKQRYWINDKYFDSSNKGGPLFLNVCGEWTCSEPKETDYLVQLAKKFKAILVTHEHRYYGESQPTSDWSTENMKYLNTDQAMADLAHFMNTLSKEFATKYNIPLKRWVIFGGSYPGALVSWFRGKFPHIALAAWSSSGVVNAIKDFHQYDEIVSYSIRKDSYDCLKKVEAMMDYTNKEFEEKRGDAIKKQWESEKMDDEDFFVFYSDMFAGIVQYGEKSDLCLRLKNIKDDYVEMNKILYDWKGKDAREGYTIETMTNIAIDPNKNSRQWAYQYCSMFGWYQTAGNIPHPLKNKAVNVDYYDKSCKKIFGIDFNLDVSIWNDRHGATNPSITKVIYLNGDEDPWKTAGITSSTDPQIHTIVIKCNGCAHCVDLKARKAESDPLLLDARAKAESILENWLKLEKEGEIKNIEKNNLESYINSRLK